MSISQIPFDDDRVLVWEWINPSDPYSIEGPHRIVAAVTLCVGRGSFGLDAYAPSGECIGTSPVSLLAFVSGPTQEEVVRDLVGQKTVIDLLCEDPDLTARVCHSVRLCSPSRRAEFDKAIAAICGSDPSPDEFLAAWGKVHDDRRSSMSDFGRSCMDLAVSIRKEASRRAESAGPAVAS